MKNVKIIAASILALIAVGTVFLKVANDNKNNNQKSNVVSIKFSELKEKIENKDDFVLVITQEGCSHCKNYAPTIKKVSNKYDIKIYDLDLTKLSDEEKKELVTIANVSGTPTTIFFKDGEEKSTLDRLNGAVSESKLVSKLKKLGYIGD